MLDKLLNMFKRYKSENIRNKCEHDHKQYMSLKLAYCKDCDYILVWTKN